ncbi:MAG: lysylphosphatidylglycerol synthase transmembrane domain-containing protein [Myxococcota bacterium]
MKSKKKLVSTVLGIAISVAALVIIFKKIDVAVSVERIMNSRWELIPAMMSVYLFSFIARGVRWQLMLKHFGDIPFKSSFNGVALGYAGNNVLPGRGGEFVRMEYLTRSSQIPRVTVLSSIFAERVIDGLVLLLILYLSMLAARSSITKEEWLLNLLVTSGVIFGAAFASIVFIRIFGGKIARYLSERTGWVFQVASKLLENIASALYFFNNNTGFYVIILLSILVWLIEGAVFVLGLIAVNMGVNLPMAYLCLSVVNFGLLIPSSPGYIGVFQGMTILCLSLFGVMRETSFSASVLIHMSQFIPITLVGLIIFMIAVNKMRMKE